MPFIRKAIDELLEHTGLTQRQLANELDVHQSTIYRWLYTEYNPTARHFDALYKVARKYNLEVEFYEKP